MSTDRGVPPTKAERIAAARRELARRHAEDPASVVRYNARMAKIAAAAKRERDRVDYLVLGKERPTEKVIVGKRGGRRRPKTMEVPVRIDPDIERAVALREMRTGHATPETKAHAARTHDGALAQLHLNGTIDAEQLEWTAQIANVHRSIESDVAVSIASLEARVDTGTRAPAIAERIHRVRMHGAYTFWRRMLPMPKGLVLDMIVGDAVGYTVAAARHRVHNRKAKRLLLEAIQRWPFCVAHAFSVVDEDLVDAMNMARRPAAAPMWPDTVERRYQFARSVETGRERTDEPYLLPALDPAFLDERGMLRPWSQIAAIIRDKVFGTEASLEQ
jgi:hypothetical protein